MHAGTQSGMEWERIFGAFSLTPHLKVPWPSRAPLCALPMTSSRQALIVVRGTDSVIAVHAHCSRGTDGKRTL